MSSSTSTARPNIVDIEASGFGSLSYPIEVGIVKASGERYCTLIIPHESWTHWCDKAESVHGISRRVLFAHGKPVEQVCNELNEFVGDSTLYCDAWSHDSRWMNKLYAEARINCTFRVSPIESIVTEEQLSYWDDTKIKVVENMRVNRHRASADALIIQETFMESRRLSVA